MHKFSEGSFVWCRTNPDAVFEVMKLGPDFCIINDGDTDIPVPTTLLNSTLYIELIANNVKRGYGRKRG